MTKSNLKIYFLGGHSPGKDSNRAEIIEES